MATSGDNSFNPNVGDLIRSALEDVGAIEMDLATVPATMVTRGQFEANLEMLALQKLNVHLWAREWITGNSLTIDQQEFTIPGDDIINVMGVNVLYDNSTPWPVQLVDIKKFHSEIGALDSSGRPTIASVEPQFIAGEYRYKLRLWPIPDDTYDISILAVKKNETFLADTDNVAMAMRWMDAFKAGLVVRLAPKFGNNIERLSYFERKYEEAKRDVNKNESTGRQLKVRGAYGQKRKYRRR